MCVCNVAGVLFYEPLEGVSAMASLSIFGFVYSALAAASFVVIWFFWKGRNWARWLVLATSLLALLNLLWFWPAGLLARCLLISEGLIGAWLLLWLNTAAARRFFIPEGRGRDAPAAG
jgi:hypothetical protein